MAGTSAGAKRGWAQRRANRKDKAENSKGTPKMTGKTLKNAKARFARAEKSHAKRRSLNLE